MYWKMCTILLNISVKSRKKLLYIVIYMGATLYSVYVCNYKDILAEISCLA